MPFKDICQLSLWSSSAVRIFVYLKITCFFYENSIIVQAVRLWNVVPVEIRRAHSLMHSYLYPTCYVSEFICLCSIYFDSIILISISLFL